MKSYHSPAILGTVADIASVGDTGTLLNGSRIKRAVLGRGRGSGRNAEDGNESSGGLHIWVWMWSVLFEV